MRRAAAKVTGREPLVVGPGVKTGLDIRIDNPAQLGSDLVVGAVAAIEEYPCPLVVVDLGTATTLSLIHICPGPAFLPSVPAPPPPA